ncbi:ferrous iron transport protein B [Vaginisenegalia massiliensis]|uniref:ferrous iron transport protein B n=1 Tax=Vaginisenegalia massiliensis TaxID=2058294 RepID=UPI000F5322AE|nr:ferrous iron transport protein B [Vaginisenegalia massiliensis]
MNIVLAGNPNCGKTSVFNLLTGTHQFVGNWPGVTVERKQGLYRQDHKTMIHDLPGIYSLSPYSPEEVVARDYLLSHHADVILNIVDANNLERNLYLTSQLIEIGIPLVLAVNMLDIAEKNQKVIDLDKLAYQLNIPVVAISGLHNQGLDVAIKVCQNVHQEKIKTSGLQFDSRIETALNEIEYEVHQRFPELMLSRWTLIKLFEQDPLTNQSLQLDTSCLKAIEEIIQITEKIFQDDAEALVINERFGQLAQIYQFAVHEKEFDGQSITDKIDHLVTHRLWAFPIFTGIMWAIYFLSIQTVGTMGTDWLNDQLFGQIIPTFTQSLLNEWQTAPWLQDLIINGIIAGIGSVIGFLPQLMVLFFCLALLEDCGYMARIAFVMDRLFRKFGLSGKSFIPMLIATGCGVPGVMASRTIEQESDRRMTIMLTTFMPCSAKLPIISLIAGAFFPKATWVAPSAYFVGIAAIILSGIGLKKTKLFQGKTSPFIMELPIYHWPRLQNIGQYTWDHSKAFLKKAGTIIYVSSIIIWFISNYNFLGQHVNESASILAVLGNLIAPVFRPLGFGDWQASVATLTGLVAKENIIASFGVLFKQSTVSETGQEVWTVLQQHYSKIGAYSFLMFNLLCAPCFAAIGAIHREMAALKWTIFAISYQCGLAYLVCFIFNQLALTFIEQSLNFSRVLAFISLLGLIYFIFRQPKNKDLS